MRYAHYNNEKIHYEVYIATYSTSTIIITVRIVKRMRGI